MMMTSLKRFADCEHSVFVSYAHADNLREGNWIGDFANQLERELGAELARVPGLKGGVPPVHLSEYNGPVSGELSAQLAARIAASFAMVIVVDRQYCESEWCLKELQIFVELFGKEGLDARLYVLALSEPAIMELTQRPTWQSCFAGRSQVWKPFYSNELGKPLVPVLRPDAKALSTGFMERFDPLREDLVGKIKQDLAGPPPPPQRKRLLFGVTTPDLADDVRRLAEDMRHQHEPSVGLLDERALLGDLRELTAADALILAFNNAQPLFPFMPGGGGHLAMQIEAWGRHGLPRDMLHLLDLSEVAAHEPAKPEHLAFLDTLRPAALKYPELVAKLFPPPEVQDQQLPKPRSVRLYIESNPVERDQWQKMAPQIQRRWKSILESRHVEASLALRPRGLNVDAIDQFDLNAADGLILLWGQTETRSLLSHIDMVEDRVDQLAPAIVAYLSPPKPRSDRALPAAGWQVLRFNQSGPPCEDDIEPHKDDEGELNEFLTGVLERTSKRYGISLS